MNKRAPDLSDPGWYRHSYLLETTHCRCSTCGETSTHSSMWLTKAHMTYTPSTGLTHRQRIADCELDPNLPTYQLERDELTPICHQCFDPQAQQAAGHTNTLIRSTEAGWKEALAADARKRRAAATINATTLEKRAEKHKRVAALLDSI